MKYCLFQWVKRKKVRNFSCRCQAICLKKKRGKGEGKKVISVRTSRRHVFDGLKLVLDVVGKERTNTGASRSILCGGRK